MTLEVEHPTGFFTVGLEVEASSGEVVPCSVQAYSCTNRMLMRGEVLIPKSIWGVAKNRFKIFVCWVSEKSDAPLPRI